MSKTKAAQDWSGSIARSWFFLHLQVIACGSFQDKIHFCSFTIHI
jgi:hypothetical protein